ncbi:Serine phosphatase RsbU, regulator of sigma subunit [Olavius sp. associated proteobacterium Delta 1]|nr:Serine phosphatase RsbU, regulator of sigma subunit [Olavius sp. associated proteobacterium Delta 1]
MKTDKPKSDFSGSNSSASISDKENSKLEKEETKIQEDRYRVLIEDVADGFYEVDLHGNFRFFNNALCRIFGYSKDEIQQRNFTEFMDEKNARIAYDAFNRTYRTGAGIVDIKWEIARKDGEKRHLEISANLISDEDGKSTGFRGIARDVTDRVLAGQALKESESCALELSQTSRRAERRYRAFLSFLPDPVFVFNMDHTVSYLNPAFEKVFGWTLEELEGKIIPSFVPDEMKEKTRLGIKQLFEEKALHGFETKRRTKDGRVLDIIIDGAIFFDIDNQPAGQVITLRDITREKRETSINQALFRIAGALHRYRGLDARLGFITKEVQNLMGVEGASVILLDEEKKEFFFREAKYDDGETGKKMKEIRFPVDKGVAGQVYRTGKPLVVPDTAKDPHFFGQVDEKSQYQTRSMLDVPIQIQDRLIGVLCAVNKKGAAFEQADIDLLAAIANYVALPIENASINEELKRSYQEVKSLNRAKDRVIHHLSHELKTPLSILSASMSILKKRLAGLEDHNWGTILDRAQRNLDRLLEMQYQIEDILREKDYKIYYMLSSLLDACSDELQVLVSESLEEKDIIDRLRQHIEKLFGPHDARSEEIRLDQFVAKQIQGLRARFAHRQCRVNVLISSPVPAVWIPRAVLAKIVDGLVRNAVENTPDSGIITVTVRSGEIGPEIEVRDSGIGISEENQRLLFDNYFTAYDTMQYSSRNPYDFGAGGKGFDLLRMKIFSERYHFELKMQSRRCGVIPGDADVCPGNMAECVHAGQTGDCLESGGTTVTVQFYPADRFQNK